MSDTYRKNSRKEWSRPDEKIYDEDLKIGCLQRIADATELMARRHQELLDEKNDAINSRDYWRALHDEIERSNRSLRGQITKLKRKAAVSVE